MKKNVLCRRVGVRLVVLAAALALGGCGEKKTELGEGGSVVSGSAGPAGAKGADKSLTQCDAPVATLALVGWAAVRGSVTLATALSVPVTNGQQVLACVSCSWLLQIASTEDTVRRVLMPMQDAAQAMKRALLHNLATASPP